MTATIPMFRTPLAVEVAPFAHRKLANADFPAMAWDDESGEAGAWTATDMRGETHLIVEPVGNDFDLFIVRQSDGSTLYHERLVAA